MRELDRIRHGLAAAATRGDRVMLATVMGVEGSVYRGAGARMLVTSSGETIGAVSGGCLEADIVARAPDVIAADKPELVSYDTRASDDIVLGLGLGCQGIIDLLLEPLAGEKLAGSVEFYDRLASLRAPVTLLTVTRGNGTGPVVGTRLVIDDSGNVIEGDPILLAHEPSVAREIVRPATPLVICGGGTDAIPLVRLAKLMGWHVTVVDHRSSFATTARFPEANAVICANVSENPSSLAEHVALDAQTMAVVMAHSATHDRAYLHAMLSAGASYVGVLGPLRRTLELLGERGQSAASALPPAVHAPVGLDIGAESPEEIALAIVAEISAVSAGRIGGLLRDRPGPIHERARRNAY
jgi:xanthine/CO dehydrogenase XdhC/CoxF family maturation factor